MTNIMASGLILAARRGGALGLDVTDDPGYRTQPVDIKEPITVFSWLLRRLIFEVGPIPR
jgi:hypothetical protein